MLTIFTSLYNRSLELFHLANLKVDVHQTPFLLLPTPGNFLSISLTTLGTSCKWNHTAFVLLCLACSTWHNVLKVHPCCSILQNSPPFWGWIIFHHCMDTPHFIYPFICQWTFELLPLLGCCENHCCEHAYTNSSSRLCFHFFWVWSQKCDYWIIR